MHTDLGGGCACLRLYKKEEYGFHVVVSCTRARAFQEVLRQDWELPPGRNFVNTGPECLLVLLDNIGIEAKSHVLFLL